jgi:hypothetical protein
MTPKKAEQELEIVQPDMTPGLLSLTEEEKIIEKGLGTFRDVGWALSRIQDGKKYRDAGYSTFERYCEQRWGLVRQQAYRTIEAAQTAEILSPNGDILQPRSESQLRPLTLFRDEPELQREIWAKAVEAAQGSQPTQEQVKEAAKPFRPPTTQPDTEVPAHPARYSDEIVPILAKYMAGYARVLDPFAGTGRVHEAADAAGIDSVGVELEPEWASSHERTVVGSALILPYNEGAFDCICTSPCYGNRLADHHDAQDGSTRRSYTHDLGRDLTPGNAGLLQWGDEYKSFHVDAWDEAFRVLSANGRFILNISDHIRDGEQIQVSAWHLDYLARVLGLGISAMIPVETRRMRYGENADARPLVEYVFVLDRQD